MSERDPSRGAGSSRADETLLGVAPPRVDDAADSLTRRPVFVRAGTSVVDAAADTEPPPLPRMALPSRPVVPLTGSAGFSEALPAASTTHGRGGGVLGALRRYPVLWMVGAPVLVAASVIALLSATSTSSGSKPGRFATGSASAPTAVSVPAKAKVAAAKPKVTGLPELEGRPAETLNANELLRLAAGRSERRVEAAKALREKLGDNPSLVNDKAVQSELFKLAGDAETARDALAAMAAARAPTGADLLYEVWTGTSARTEATELAHALVYSTDVRPQASPALAVALELRAAERCEQFESALPQALKAGDRRVLHLLTKLNNKRGCGPKKTDDCFACLRDQQVELTAAINAVKARPAPVYPAAQ